MQCTSTDWLPRHRHTSFYKGLPERFGQITNLIWLRLRLPQHRKQSAFDSSARLVIPDNIKILLENIKKYSSVCEAPSLC